MGKKAVSGPKGKVANLSTEDAEREDALAKEKPGRGRGRGRGHSRGSSDKKVVKEAKAARPLKRPSAAVEDEEHDDTVELEASETTKGKRPPRAKAVHRRPAAASATGGKEDGEEDVEAQDGEEPPQKKARRATAKATASGEDTVEPTPEGEQATPIVPAAPVKAVGSVGNQYVRGVRVYSAWAAVPGTSRRCVGPSRTTQDKAEADVALIEQLAEKGTAGEELATKWRNGEVPDSNLRKLIKDLVVTADQPARVTGASGSSTKGRGRGSQRSPSGRGPDKSRETSKAGGRGGGRGRGRGHAKSKGGNDNPEE